MATLYQFLVKDQTSDLKTGGKGDTLASATNVGGKKPRTGSNKGVEHNRYMRAINPIMNKATGGYYEKGTRLGRAIIGFADTYNEKGLKAGLTSVGFIIIVQMVLNAIMQIWRYDQEIQDKLNKQDYTSLEVGKTSLSYGYKSTVNLINGRREYNDNK